MPLTTERSVQDYGAVHRASAKRSLVSLRMVGFIVVVSIFVAIAFSIFGNRDDRASFHRAVTPVRVLINPIEPVKSIANTGTES